MSQHYRNPKRESDPPALPGCLPDSDVMGPFETEEKALEDAREGIEEEEEESL